MQSEHAAATAQPAGAGKVAQEYNRGKVDARKKNSFSFSLASCQPGTVKAQRIPFIHKL